MSLSFPMPPLRLTALSALTLFSSSAFAADNGLLFYASGDKGTTAEVATAGTNEPTFVANVSNIPDGAKGGALKCEDLQRLAWRAPGNIYAQRGTLSFFWRSRYSVGPTEFPIFRVGYADHSSWDMVWLRIDYNGHGFDAFVTDASLARTRVSVTLPTFPKPNEWTHLSLAWDENRGIRFYVNGQLAAKQETVAVYNAGLDQFGPHSRVISPYQVQSDYNFVRGGDIDEIRIYDRMLDDSAFVALAKGDAPTLSATPTRSLADATTRAEWSLRYGWNREAPPELPAGSSVSIRKVEIHDAFDKGRWWWKANDGIRETTWPGVLNRSRLAGRHDYFTLPDWDCYVDSGKAVTFALPKEPWNQLEIAGSAAGKIELLAENTNIEKAEAVPAERELATRAKGQERTIHRLAQPITGQKVRFVNAEQEDPIGEFEALNIAAGTEPAQAQKLAFRLVPQMLKPEASALQAFISGRFAPDERAAMTAVKATEPLPTASRSTASALPIVHLLVPDSWDDRTDGLDGIAITLPALNLKPGTNGLIALNLQVKDPLWPNRDMLDVTFGVKPGQAKTLWLDLRDRLLPAKKDLWLTIASDSADFNETTLSGAELRLVFKPHEAARVEHEIDRFTQARDSYAMLVEEHPRSPKYDLWNRFEADLKDLLRVNPEHELGRLYAAAGMDGAKPAFTQPVAPDGVPLWAFRQTELLGRVKQFVLWYIDHRQSSYGDLGGGISDDVDLTNHWPGVALMGAEPEKIRASLQALLEAAYKNGMFTRGLPTIQTDELHTYEEGINCLAQNLVLNYGSPRQLERAMETARGYETVTGVNSAGHRHVRSTYYSGSKMATEDPWGWTKPYSYLVAQVPQMLVDFNGNPTAKKYLLELTDGLLAHRKVGADGRVTIPTTIRFDDDREGDATRNFNPWHMLWGAWKWTGDQKYLQPLSDGGPASALAINANALDILDLRKELNARMLAAENRPATETRPKDGRPPDPTARFRSTLSAHFQWQLSGDKKFLETLYANQIQDCAQMQFINTEGSLWIDRVGVPYAELQRARLGGLAIVRNSLYPGHVVSWKFAAPATEQSVAILVPDATSTGFKVIAYNLSTSPVHATMTGWNVNPGVWEIAQGVDANNDDVADGAVVTNSVPFGRSSSVELTLPPRASTVLTLKLKTPGTPYWQRSDLGLDREDVTVSGRELKVTVHSVGAVNAPAARLLARNAAGDIIATANIPALAAPTDLQPKVAAVSLSLPANATVAGTTIEIEPAPGTEEITALNNRVKL